MEKGSAGSSPAPGKTVKPRIAVFAGANATVMNTEPLLTSNKARAKYGLPLLTSRDGAPLRYDCLRPQLLAAPAKVYIRQFSAHPLEQDAAELYGPPDGYLDRAGIFHKERAGADDLPVYEVTLRPEDGLYPLPFMARQTDGSAWDGDGARPLAPAELCRQPFFPDASRLFEEIDRLGIGDAGTGCLLSSMADFDFFRAAPPGGYKKGLLQSERTDVGEGDIPPEVMGEDFFPYRPPHLRREPSLAALARLTNVVQEAMATGRYEGGIWLEASPTLEETAYWLNLLIDTRAPLTGNASHRPHGAVGNDGDRNIIDSVEYLLSRIWADDSGRDRIGVVVVQDEQIFTAREVQKVDARPGGYAATGGHGGIIGTMGQPGPLSLTFRPLKLHTWKSAVNMNRLPGVVEGVQRGDNRITRVPIKVKDEERRLLAEALPRITIIKYGRYQSDNLTGRSAEETDVLDRIDRNLDEAPLAGFVGEGTAPYGKLADTVERALAQAAFSGMPVVKVGRGNPEGMAPPNPGSPFIAGNNLTATKARLLLMACLLRFGSLPPAADPANPTSEERAALKAKLVEYQGVFDTH